MKVESLKLNRIYNEDCKITLTKMKEQNKKIDIVLTSPFYNTNVKSKGGLTLKNSHVKNKAYQYLRYDSFVDYMSNEEYCEFMVDLFNRIDCVLKKNGVVLFNICYGSENTECMFLAVSEILRKTNFTIADVIGWKKTTALPNSVSSNKLTRIFEFVFVFCRRNELKTFI